MRVTPMDVKAMIEPLGRSLGARTVRGIYGVVKTVFISAVDAALIPASPVRGVRLPTIERSEPRLLSLSELQVLRDCMPEQFGAFVFVGGVLGLRYSEIAGLRVADVDFLRRTVAVRRTIAEPSGRLVVEDVKSPASRRTLTAPPFVIDSIAEQLSLGQPPGPDQYVFTAPKGGPLRYSNFHKSVWKPAVGAAGLGHLTIHGLRHSAAGLMITGGAHPRTMMGRMGHASIATTMNVYGHLLPSADDAVNVDLEQRFQAECGADVVQGTSTTLGLAES